MIRRTLAWLSFKFWRLRVEAGALLSFYLAFLRRRSHIVSAWTNPAIPLGPRVAVFVHFDARGQVRPYVQAYLAALHASGYAIAFVSNAGRLRAADEALIRPLCHAVIIRRNVGYDFGAMREGIAFLGLPKAETEHLLIANDSVYGPLRPLPDILSRVDFTQADFWGATESWQNRYHLQSFFLLAGRKALESEAWHRFWARVRPVGSKHYVVTRYEVGLTQRLINAGLSCAALWPYETLVETVDPELLEAEGTDPLANARKIQSMRIRYAASERKPLNPTAELWRQLLLAGCPFIKRELLRLNPAGVTDIADWRALMHAEGIDISLIDQDLKRVLKHKAP